MKRVIIILLMIAVCYQGKSQNDTLIVKSDSIKISNVMIKADTIKIGNMIIINQGGNSKTSTGNDETNVNIHIRKERRSNSSSKDFVLDLGFANFDDHTNYANAQAQNYTVSRPAGSPLSANDFKLRQVKSSNVNLWFFMKRMNLVNHYVNLKYGLGLEMNNYRFEKSISFKQDGANPYTGQNINHPFAFMDSISFKKDKLATDYITVPLMINFQSNPNYSDKGISASFGISAGYLYSSRNKQVSNERGKHHNKGDFGNEKFKFSYIAELGLGKVRLYGSYSPQSIFTNGFDLRPYTLGIRFSRW